MVKKEKYGFGDGVWASYHARSKDPKIRKKAIKMLKEMSHECLKQEAKNLKKLEKQIMSKKYK